MSTADRTERPPRSDSTPSNRRAAAIGPPRSTRIRVAPPRAPLPHAMMGVVTIAEQKPRGILAEELEARVGDPLQEALQVVRDGVTQHRPVRDPDDLRGRLDADPAAWPGLRPDPLDGMDDIPLGLVRAGARVEVEGHTALPVHSLDRPELRGDVSTLLRQPIRRPRREAGEDRVDGITEATDSRGLLQVEAEAVGPDPARQRLGAIREARPAWRARRRENGSLGSMRHLQLDGGIRRDGRDVGEFRGDAPRAMTSTSYRVGRRRNGLAP